MNEKRQIKWLERNHHALRYSEGHFNLCEMSNILRRFTANTRIIIVRGHDEANILKKFVNIEIVNLEHVHDIISYYYIILVTY